MEESIHTDDLVVGSHQVKGGSRGQEPLLKSVADRSDGMMVVGQGIVAGGAAVIAGSPLRLGLGVGWGVRRAVFQGARLLLLGVELFEEFPEQRGIHVDADAHKDEPVAIACGGKDLTHMRLGNAPQVCPEQLQPEFKATEQNQTIQNINSGQHGNKQKPNVQYGEYFLVENIQWQDTQDVENVRSATRSVNEHFALGHFGKNPGCHQIPQVPVVNWDGCQCVYVLAPEPIENHIH